MVGSKVNFFIAGAPKCGTTAMSEYLRSHPGVFMATPKEPSFFAADLPGLRYVETLEDYEKLFSRAPAEARIIGEASPSYLFSGVAARGIAAYNPAARFLVMLRDPVDMLPSYHAQLCYSGFEDQPDLEQAWQLQARRRQGLEIPAGCREPALLQYGEMAAYSGQLERLFSFFPRPAVHIVLYEELVADLPGVYRRILAFLDLEEDDRIDFPAINARKAARSAGLNRLLHRPPERLRRWLTRRAGSALHDWLVRLYAMLLQANSMAVRKYPLSPGFRRQLQDFYAADRVRLEALLDRRLEGWLRAEREGRKSC